MISVDHFTPSGLTFDPVAHVYTLDDRVLVSVTNVLAAAGLADRAWFTEDDRRRGTAVHQAIERYHARLDAVEWDAVVAPYMRGYRRFLAESAFRVDVSEERLADPFLRLAGTLDLRGQFIKHDLTASERIDVVDVKTGCCPPWVGMQTAAYVRLLPAHVRPRCRRWALQLRSDGTYQLLSLDNRNDERVFLAALVIAQYKRGWL